MGHVFTRRGLILLWGAALIILYAKERVGNYPAAFYSDVNHPARGNDPGPIHNGLIVPLGHRRAEAVAHRSPEH